jgi:hypothetical protein
VSRATTSGPWHPEGSGSGVAHCMSQMIHPVVYLNTDWDADLFHGSFQLQDTPRPDLPQQYEDPLSLPSRYNGQQHDDTTSRYQLLSTNGMNSFFSMIIH